jgi:NAD/NADP transhydrogenase beta subunit
MRFTIPQFIEHETKIAGPLTFKQFMYIGMAGAAIFLLYFSMAATNFALFLLLAIIIALIALGLAFIKIGGRTLPVILANFFRFLIAPKKYIWKKKEQGQIEVFKK